MQLVRQSKRHGSVGVEEADMRPFTDVYGFLAPLTVTPAALSSTTAA